MNMRYYIHMVQKHETNWRDRLEEVDFTIIRAQLARARGVPITHVSEEEVRKKVQALRKEDERVYKKAFPPRAQKL